MILKRPTLEEVTLLEEEKLLSSLQSLNMSFKNKNKKEFVSALTDIVYDNSSQYMADERNKGKSMVLSSKIHKSRRSQSFDDLEDLEINFTLNNKTLNESISNNSNCSKSTNFNSQNYYKIENIISQNLKYTDEILKFVIIGDKACGKSTFMNNICEESASDYSHLTSYEKESQNHIKIQSYVPTRSLEIKRYNFKSINKLVKLEFWDTNVNILSSPIIKTYYKICNGFVLICEIGNFESIMFMENKIKNLLNMLKVNDNIIVFANIKDDTNPEVYFENLDYLKSLEDKYSLKINFVNFHEIKISKLIKFCKFVDQCLIKKITKSRNSFNSSKSNSFACQSDFTEEKPSRCTLRENSSSPKKRDKCVIF
jgi:GTPase SAR1 family protein